MVDNHCFQNQDIKLLILLALPPAGLATLSKSLKLSETQKGANRTLDCFRIQKRDDTSTPFRKEQKEHEHVCYGCRVPAFLEALEYGIFISSCIISVKYCWLVQPWFLKL